MKVVVWMRVAVRSVARRKRPTYLGGAVQDFDGDSGGRAGRCEELGEARGGRLVSTRGVARHQHALRVPRPDCLLAAGMP